MHSHWFHCQVCLRTASIQSCFQDLSNKLHIICLTDTEVFSLSLKIKNKEIKHNLLTMYALLCYRKCSMFLTPSQYCNSCRIIARSIIILLFYCPMCQRQTSLFWFWFWISEQAFGFCILNAACMLKKKKVNISKNVYKKKVYMCENCY